MTVKINLFYPHLQQFTNYQEQVEVNGATIGECLSDLAKRYPGIDKVIFDEQGKLISYVYVLINGKPHYPTDLSKSINDGDEISIALLLAGG